MSSSHLTSHGEDLQTITRTHGFFDPQTVWSDPANAELASARDNPFVLAPGDSVAIPALQPAKQVLATRTRHSFVVPRPPRKLRLRLLGLDGEALEGSVELDGAELPLDDGIAEAELEPDVSEVSLKIDGSARTLTIAGLDPIDTDTGLVTRLAALGYDLTLEDLDAPDAGQRVGFAIELFAHDHQLTLGGEIDDALREALVDAFGS